MPALEDLQAQVSDARTRIRTSANRQAVEVESLLDLSAQHVVLAGFGAALLSTARQPPDVGPLAVESRTIELAAYMLTFASGKTSIDLCATALLRWLGHLPTKPDREHDFGTLDLQISKGSVTMSSRQRSWFDEIDGSPEGHELRDFRDAMVHRVVRQDITVFAQQPPGAHSTRISPSKSTAGIDEAEVVLDRLAAFAEDRWRDFWNAL